MFDNGKWVYKIIPMMNELFNISDEIKNKSIQQVEELRIKTEEMFGVKLPDIEVLFKTKRSVAGLARYRIIDGKSYCHINLNPILFFQNQEYFFNQTIPHEFSHIAAYHIYGVNIEPHGFYWQNIMRKLGFNPETRHCLDMGLFYKVKASNGRKYYKYSCGCFTHTISQLIHNKILKGKPYRCSRCKSPIKLVEELA